MAVEFRLKEILQASGLDRHGTVQEIADDQALNRHTVRKLYQNAAKQVSLRTLDKLCAYLEKNRLAHAAELPGVLFARRPSELFAAIAAPGAVTMYLGQRIARSFPRAWVARDDSSAAAAINTQLTRLGRSPAVTTVHVPTHVADQEYHEAADAELVERDRAVAAAVFRRMRENRATGTAILIGSARANMLAELFLADCFFSEPYRREESRVPFWLQFPDGTWPPSCCGGPQPPRGADDCGPGIYWREGGAWEHLRAEPLKVGVGACVIRRDAGLGRLELAVFGLSAIATAGMGRLLCECSEKFWPPVGAGAGLQYGVVLCQFDLEGCESGEESIDEIRIARPQFIRLRYRVPRRRDPPRRP